GRVRRGDAAARHLRAPRAPPRRGGARVRKPPHRGDRGDHAGRRVGEPEHDVPAAARARVAASDRGPLGAPRQAHAPLLLDHARGPQGVPQARRRARAVPRLADRLAVLDQARDLRAGGRLMAEVEATMPIPVAVAEVWDLYFDQERWPTWVDGFGGVDSSQGYPEVGGTLRWH